ncbi:hypothetical protein D3C76_1586160 [compost metagenome]
MCAPVDQDGALLNQILRPFECFSNLIMTIDKTQRINGKARTGFLPVLDLTIRRYRTTAGNNGAQALDDRQYRCRFGLTELACTTEVFR